MHQDTEYKEKKDLFSRPLVWAICGIIALIISLVVYHAAKAIPVSFIAGLTFLLIVVLLACYPRIYFTGQSFHSIKKRIQKHIAECNALNRHIQNLRDAFICIRKTDYGETTFKNVSRYKYRKQRIQTAKYAPNIYDCSRTVCDNARKQPFKYICKYFNIHADEQTIDDFEEVINKFSAAEEGKYYLVQKKEAILSKIQDRIPWIIRIIAPSTLEKELGFEDFAFEELYFPTYSFRYISLGGNSGTQFDVEMDIKMMERFVRYLAESVQFKNSAEGQRRLMTSKLRRMIIERDEYTCQQCGNSTDQEPNLLLEVDHIIPVSKGGITSEENLQTLCWKCNRSKGAKVV